mgnify:CR=1 FL=1|jgi:hypothetical protein
MSEVDGTVTSIMAAEGLCTPRSHVENAFAQFAVPSIEPFHPSAIPLALSHDEQALG